MRADRLGRGAAGAGRGRVALLAVVAVVVMLWVTLVATGFFPFALLCAAAMGAAGSAHGITTQTLVQNAADVLKDNPVLGPLTNKA